MISTDLPHCGPYLSRLLWAALPAQIVQDDFLHHLVTFNSGVAAVHRVAVLHDVAVGHGWEVVDIYDAGGVGVVTQHAVQHHHVGRAVAGLGTPEEAVTGQHRAQIHFDAVQLGELAHALDVVEGVLHRDDAVVEGQVIDAGQDYHPSRIEFYDILAEAGEQAHSGLTADAAAHEAVLLEEFGAHAGPVLGDGVAVEYYVYGLALKSLVVIGIFAHLGPVVMHIVYRLILRVKSGACYQRQSNDQKAFHSSVGL